MKDQTVYFKAVYCIFRQRARPARARSVSKAAASAACCPVIPVWVFWLAAGWLSR